MHSRSLITALTTIKTMFGRLAGTRCWLTLSWDVAVAKDWLTTAAMRQIVFIIQCVRFTNRTKYVYFK